MAVLYKSQYPFLSLCARSDVQQVSSFLFVRYPASPRPPHSFCSTAPSIRTSAIHSPPQSPCSRYRPLHWHLRRSLRYTSRSRRPSQRRGTSRRSHPQTCAHPDCRCSWSYRLIECRGRRCDFCMNRRHCPSLFNGVRITAVGSDVGSCQCAEHVDRVRSGRR